MKTSDNSGGAAVIPSKKYIDETHGQLDDGQIYAFSPVIHYNWTQ